MSDHEKPMTDEQVEAMAWELESKMMEIRKDPRAALTAGLARIQATIVAKMQADLKADIAKFEAELASLMAANKEAFQASKEALQATFDALIADLTPELRAALADGLRLRAAVADSLRHP